MVEAPARQDFSNLSSMRQAIARRTTKSIEAPQAALYREIDLTELLAVRLNRGTSGVDGTDGKKVSLTALLIRNIVLALQEAPIRKEMDVIVIGVRRGDAALGFNPPPDLALRAGDVLIALGSPDNLERLSKLARG